MKFLILEDLVVDVERILKIVPKTGGGAMIVIFDNKLVESKESTKTPFKDVVALLKQAKYY